MNQNVRIGQYAVIGENVTIGEDVVIGHHVVIYDGTIIGNQVVIHDHAIIGKKPMKAHNSATTTNHVYLLPAIIADRCIIGSSSVIYANAFMENDVFVADLATIRERVVIGEKTIIGRGVAVENDCTIGSNCKLETNCYICAFSTLEDDVFVAPCVVTTNDNYLGRTKERFGKFKGVTIKKGGRIGANATILPGKIIEEEGVVAAGSIVTKNVKSKELVAGSPARKIRDVPPEQWLENQ
ncbi:N-acetyltransferase [Paenibacillus sp. LPE1-1-1.1]|uniref:N-acetyltransferase n=1 Tax=Paenibacillus sp. LPE1-1-1.1 TaxID=3135230 RepID=UPI003425F433